MPWHPTLTALCTSLATLYPTVEDARRVVADAGLDPLRIAFDAKAITNWQHILEEAVRANQVDQLLVVARTEYAENPELAAAVQAYQAMRAAQPPSSEAPPTHIESPPTASTTIATGGGAAFTGPVTVGGDLIGRDQIIHQHGFSADEVARIVQAATQPDAKPPPQSTPVTFERLPFEPETMLIPAGPFWMGSDEGPEHERPQHEVTLAAYRMGKYPVTNVEYAEFMHQSGQVAAPELGWAGQRPLADQERHPVSGVTWHEALAYCVWLSAATGRTYTLPSEAQWEKAARGVDERIYPWGNDWAAARCNLGATATVPVDHFPAQSVYGCYDLVGNGREWTASLWGERLVTPELRYRYPWRDDGRHDLTAHDQIRRVWRGSAYNDLPQQCRCAARGAQLPTSRGGPQTRFRFRVVMTI